MKNMTNLIPTIKENIEIPIYRVLYTKTSKYNY